MTTNQDPIEPMQPGPELDRLVAEKVMGWHIESDGSNEVWINPAAKPRGPMWADYTVS